MHIKKPSPQKKEKKTRKKGKIPTYNKSTHTPYNALFISQGMQKRLPFLAILFTFSRFFFTYNYFNILDFIVDRF